MEAHLNIINAQIANRIFEMDHSAIYLIALFLEQFGYILHSNRTKEPILFSDLDLRGQRIGLQLLGCDFKSTALALGTRFVLFAARLELGHVGVSGDQRLVAWNQEIAAIPAFDLNDLTGRTQRFDILQQNYFHEKTSTR